MYTLESLPHAATSTRRMLLLGRYALSGNSATCTLMGCSALPLETSVMVTVTGPPMRSSALICVLSAMIVWEMSTAMPPFAGLGGPRVSVRRVPGRRCGRCAGPSLGGCRGCPRSRGAPGRLASPSGHLDLFVVLELVEP